MAPGQGWLHGLQVQGTMKTMTKCKEVSSEVFSMEPFKCSSRVIARGTHPALGKTLASHPGPVSAPLAQPRVPTLLLNTCL